uniref:Uncharacterized protein n=1 Tax=Anguilla anguilla TaxID=7936 RepID=A0A0E9XZL3_ANGAN
MQRGQASTSAAVALASEGSLVSVKQPYVPTTWPAMEIIDILSLQTSSSRSFSSETHFLTVSKEICGLLVMLGKSPGPGGSKRDLELWRKWMYSSVCERCSSSVSLLLSSAISCSSRSRSPSARLTATFS